MGYAAGEVTAKVQDEVMVEGRNTINVPSSLSIVFTQFAHRALLVPALGQDFELV